MRAPFWVKEIRSEQLGVLVRSSRSSPVGVWRPLLRLFFVGLATDFSVAWSAIDIARVRTADL